MTREAPVLIATAHGTSSPAGRAAIAGLVAAVAARRPDLTVRAAYVDVQQPEPAAVLASLGGAREGRLVPLLLSAGYHVYVDLTDAADAVPGTTVAPALGPDDRLAELLRRRLVASGLRDDDVVVLGAAGSSQPSAVEDCRTVADALSRLLGRPVTAAFLSAAEPRLSDAVAAQGLPGRRVIVATYLLAPGYFADLSAASGADVVTPPLLLPDEPVPDELVDIVLERYLS
ncbi:sirohydrochlorin chelatase [Terrabacter sp. MAHUQ-38]|uniref:sirohydrochlorin chelatase n=1 Tax=unclassified Terrabacter TaxID=2630222 RepID=UPI00165DBA05|nr:CbiX/SirB N-terminal domain-containing protein [Terrabacter sp. MAHUQ-38]MBC9822069.1 cobalamin biosynthesis protein CbiX [Terrabacter sp. MAHUQ-38]